MVSEIPRGSANKYEFDFAMQQIRLTRRLPLGARYPTDYGFVPGTLAKDGDPLDVLVLGREPTFPGGLLRVLPLGVLWTRDQEGRDPKLVCVLETDARMEDLYDIEDVPNRVLREIEHFFEVDKDLEPDKYSEVEGFSGRREAEDELRRAQLRLRDGQP